MKPNLSELTDEEVEKTLSGGASAGPLKWRGKLLAKFGFGLKDLALRVISDADTVVFHDVAILAILAAAYGENEEEILEKRKALMIRIDKDPQGFRLGVSMEIDEIGDADTDEARKLVRAAVAAMKPKPDTLATTSPTASKAAATKASGKKTSKARK